MSTKEQIDNLSNGSVWKVGPADTEDYGRLVREVERFVEPQGLAVKSTLTNGCLYLQVLPASE